MMNNNLASSTNKSDNDDAGIEVDGQYVPNHMSADEREALMQGEELAGKDPVIMEALDHGKPEVPETSDAEALADEDVLPAGIQTGQTARGSYSTDQSTGGGGYRDHRAGQFGTEEVAQPGNDDVFEPDPVDKGF